MEVVVRHPLLCTGRLLSRASGLSFGNCGVQRPFSVQSRSPRWKSLSFAQAIAKETAPNQEMHLQDFHSALEKGSQSDRQAYEEWKAMDRKLHRACAADPLCCTRPMLQVATVKSVKDLCAKTLEGAYTKAPLRIHSLLNRGANKPEVIEVGGRGGRRQDSFPHN